MFDTLPRIKSLENQNKSETNFGGNFLLCFALTGVCVCAFQWRFIVIVFDSFHSSILFLFANFLKKKEQKNCKSSVEPSITKFWKPKNSRHVVYILKSFTKHLFLLVVKDHAPLLRPRPSNAPSVQCCRVPPRITEAARTNDDRFNFFFGIKR